DKHSENVLHAMQTIMSLVLNEYEEPPRQLLSMLEEEMSQEAPCIAHTLAKDVINQCPIKLKTYMAAKLSERDMESTLQGMSSLVFNDKNLVSNVCMKLGACIEKSDLVQMEEKEEDANKQGKGSLLIEE
ncbi:hypothetical protein KI387_032653, partial [Taxus chinensis]